MDDKVWDEVIIMFWQVFFAVIAVCAIFAAVVTMVNFLPMPSNSDRGAEQHQQIYDLKQKHKYNRTEQR